MDWRRGSVENVRRTKKLIAKPASIRLLFHFVSGIYELSFFDILNTIY